MAEATFAAMIRGPLSQMAEIHPTAVIEPGAEIAQSVRIGPYCHVGAKVVLGDEVELLSHVVLAGSTSIGAGTAIFPFASIGHRPQDLKYKGEDSALIIGARQSHPRTRHHESRHRTAAAW